jgi:hypothetical protein
LPLWPQTKFLLSIFGLDHQTLFTNLGKKTLPAMLSFSVLRVILRRERGKKNRSISTKKWPNGKESYSLDYQYLLWNLNVPCVIILQCPNPGILKTGLPDPYLLKKSNVPLKMVNCKWWTDRKVWATQSGTTAYLIF